MAKEHEIERTWFSNTSRFRLLNLLKEFAERIPPGSLVLDAGAGDQHYKPLFAHARYESADIMLVDKAYEPPTYSCDLSNIPVDDDRYDFILFNQVLEHVAEPQIVINELARVLKPRGVILCTCPFFYEEHEVPYDYFRYTQFALRKMFEAASLEVRSLAKLEGYLTTLSYQLEGAYRHLPTRPSSIGSQYAYALCPLFFTIKIVSALLAGILYRLDRLDGLKGFGYSKNYVIFATKKS